MKRLVLLWGLWIVLCSGPAFSVTRVEKCTGKSKINVGGGCHAVCLQKCPNQAAAQCDNPIAVCHHQCWPPGQIMDNAVLPGCVEVWPLKDRWEEWEVEARYGAAGAILNGWARARGIGGHKTVTFKLFKPDLTGWPPESIGGPCPPGSRNGSRLFTPDV